MAWKKRNHNDTASCTFYFLSADDLVESPISTLDKNIRQKSGNQFTRSERVENHHGIHTFKGSQDFSALVLRYRRAAFSLEFVHGSVAVDANNEHIAERPALLQALQVPEVKNVKAAIGENHSPTVAFIGAKPQNRLLKSEYCRVQRISMRTQARMSLLKKIVYHARWGSSPA